MSLPGSSAQPVTGRTVIHLSRDCLIPPYIGICSHFMVGFCAIVARFQNIAPVVHQVVFVFCPSVGEAYLVRPTFSTFEVGVGVRGQDGGEGCGGVGEG